MRTFIALEIPAEVKAALAALQDALRPTRPDVNWTAPPSLHLTLKFLGEIAEQAAPEVEKVCVETAAQFQPFKLRLNNVGVFPNDKQARVLWAGLAGAVETTIELHQQLDEQLALLGYERETKRFHPHLTVGRIKSPKNLRPLLGRAYAYALPPLEFTVSEIVLMRSDLSPAGARYTPLATAALGS